MKNHSKVSNWKNYYTLLYCQNIVHWYTYLERIADKMCERLDAKVKIMTEQLKVRDQKIQALENTVNTLQLKIDDQEQYSRREVLRITGKPETENENTDQLVMALCNDTLKLPPCKIQIWRGSIDLVMLAKVTGLFWRNLLHTKFATKLSGQEPTWKTTIKTITPQYISTKIWPRGRLIYFTAHDNSRMKNWF